MTFVPCPHHYPTGESTKREVCAEVVSSKIQRLRLAFHVGLLPGREIHLVEPQLRLLGLAFLHHKADLHGGPVKEERLHQQIIDIKFHMAGSCPDSKDVVIIVI